MTISTTTQQTMPMLKWLRRFMFGNPERERATDELRKLQEEFETEAAKVETGLDRVISSRPDDPFGAMIHQMRGAQFRKRLKKHGLQ